VLRDYLPSVMVGLSAGGLLIVWAGPDLHPTWYARVLRTWGRRRGVAVDFVLDPGRRLREGPEIEKALGRLWVRQASAIFVTVGAFGVMFLSLFYGPRLSQSTANSVVVAGVPLVATALAALLLRGFTEPYRTVDGEPRATGAEDYVWPAVRALSWVSAGVAVLVPPLFLVLAAGPAYDGGKLFWEGLVALPLTGVVLVVAVERWLGGVTDVADRTDTALYVWDCLRGRSAKILLALAFANLALGFEFALGGLQGVARVGPPVGMFDQLSLALRLMGLMTTVGLLVVLLQPLAPRLRKRLWPALVRTGRVEFRASLPTA
jgi:hypothetical protein